MGEDLQNPWKTGLGRRLAVLALLISDLGLPDGSGLDVMRALSRFRVPGIALSGYGMEEDIRGSHEAGFTRHLTKPVSLPQLQAALHEVARGGE